MHKLLLGAVLAMSGVAFAHADNFYGGVSLGQKLDSRFDNPTDSTHRDNPAAFYLGWNFVPHWSVEGTYYDFGKARCCGRDVADFGFRTTTEGWSVGMVFNLDFNGFEPLFKLAYFDARTHGHVVTIAGPRRINYSDNGLMAEIGLRYRINEMWAVRAGYEWFDFDHSDGGARLAAEIHF